MSGIGAEAATITLIGRATRHPTGPILKPIVDDAMHATRAALEEGVVPGGGVALLYAIKAIDKLTQSSSSAIQVEAKHTLDALNKSD